MSYEHTQTSKAVLVAPVVAAMVFIITAVATQEMVVLLPTAAFVALMAAILLTASWLTVTVSSHDVRAAFGLGWPRRMISLSDIVSAEPVRNSWFYGWGIRLIPHGWMFNVWGLDAVELELTSGRRFRIGTDEPAELTDAIRSALQRPETSPPDA